ALFALAHSASEKPRQVHPLAKYPPIARDIAIVLREGIESERVEAEIRKAISNDLLRDIHVFDAFRSPEMKQAHERSLAFHLVFRSEERTLEETEADEAMSLILKHLERELQARIRV